jgi:hypothetical protein
LGELSREAQSPMARVLKSAWLLVVSLVLNLLNNLDGGDSADDHDEQYGTCNKSAQPLVDKRIRSINPARAA